MCGFTGSKKSGFLTVTSLFLFELRMKPHCMTCPQKVTSMRIWLTLLLFRVSQKLLPKLLMMQCRGAEQAGVRIGPPLPTSFQLKHRYHNPQPYNPKFHHRNIQNLKPIPSPCEHDHTEASLETQNKNIAENDFKLL